MNSERKIELLRKALNDLLDHDVANRGSQYAFFCCYTYGRKMPKQIKAAELVLKRTAK